MEDLDGPLDFETEDPLDFSAPLANDGKRKKIIGLDDLLSEFHHEVNPVNEAKKKSKTKRSNSDDEDCAMKSKEELLSKFVSECQKQVDDILAEDNIPLWGRQAFGPQRSPPPFDSEDLMKSKLLQSLMKSQLNSVLDITAKQAELFLEGLLTDGWLLNLVYLCGSVEDSLASWLFYQTLYSSRKDVHESGCELWCNVLQPEAEVGNPKVSIQWFPRFGALKDALQAYGYSSCPGSFSPSVPDNNGSEICGPPVNIRSWLKLVAAISRTRNPHRLFSTSEAEELFDVIIWLFLDRRLQGLSFLLNDCLLSIISFFTENEWHASSEMIAAAIAARNHKETNKCRTVGENNPSALRVPMDLNCLRIVECISGVDKRSRAIRSQLSSQILLQSMGRPGAKTLDMLKMISLVNLKDKNCDFLKIYIRLVLAENWPDSSFPVEEKEAISEVWSKYLRILSTQISNTDWRPYAAKLPQLNECQNCIYKTLEEKFLGTMLTYTNPVRQDLVTVLTSDSL